jgi:hypothetical protein
MARLLSSSHTELAAHLKRFLDHAGGSITGAWVSGAAPTLRVTVRRSHRDAGLAVLLAPDVPAVLLEMGFITNPDDQALLADPASRGRLVGAVASAIEAYFRNDVQVASR